MIRDHYLSGNIQLDTVQKLHGKVPTPDGAKKHSLLQGIDPVNLNGFPDAKGWSSVEAVFKGLFPETVITKSENRTAEKIIYKKGAYYYIYIPKNQISDDGKGQTDLTLQQFMKYKFNLVWATYFQSGATGIIATDNTESKSNLYSTHYKNILLFTNYSTELTGEYLYKVPNTEDLQQVITNFKSIWDNDRYKMFHFEIMIG